MVKYDFLKNGIFQSSQTDLNIEYHRYIIENNDDLLKFMAVFTEARPLLYKLFKKYLTEGRIIIATDLHPMTQQPTYCFESFDFSHPSHFVRKKN